MNNINLHILEKVVTGTATVEELSAFQQWLELSDDNRQLFERVKHYYSAESDSVEPTQRDIDISWSRFEKSQHGKFTDQRRRLVRRLTSTVAAVAAIVVVSVMVINKVQDNLAGSFFEERIISEVEFISKLIEPIENTVDPDRITLVTGSGEIHIDSADQNRVGELPVAKIGNNALIYNKDVEQVAVEYHTLSIPKGKTFLLTLSDGTIVHLNANSKLIYPSNFSGADERRVKLSGEGYFEVAHDKNCRFVVETEFVDVTVYGTKFNISTYKPSVVETVLLEGSVSIKNDSSKEVMLKPNQLAYYSQGKDMVISDVDAENYISWCNDVYCFYNQSFYSIMSYISAYYGYEVRFDSDKIARMHFICNIPRFETIDEVMKVLSLSNSFSYTIKNNIVTISAL